MLLINAIILHHFVDCRSFHFQEFFFFNKNVSPHRVESPFTDLKYRTGASRQSRVPHIDRYSGIPKTGRCMTVEIASSTEPAVWNAVNFGRCCIDVPPSLRCLIGRAMYYEGRLRAGSIPDPQPRARAISRRSNSTFRNLSCIPPRQAIVS